MNATINEFTSSYSLSAPGRELSSAEIVAVSGASIAEIVGGFVGATLGGNFGAALGALAGSFIDKGLTPGYWDKLPGGVSVWQGD